MKIKKFFYILFTITILMTICFTAIASNRYNSPRDCSKSRNHYEQVRCYTRLAQLENNVSHCFEIKPNKESGNLVNYLNKIKCINTVVRQSTSTSICDNINSENFPGIKGIDKDKNRCIATIAAKLLDKEVCNQITDKKWKKICLRGIKRNTLASASPHIREVTTVLFYILVIALFISLILLKIKSKKILQIATFSLLPVIMLFKFSFRISSSYDYLIMLAYCGFFLAMLISRLKTAFQLWLNNEPEFKRVMLLTYLYASILFLLVGPFLGFVQSDMLHMGPLNSFGDFFSIILFGIFLSPATIMVFIFDVASIIFLVKAWPHRKTRMSHFLYYSLVSSIIFTIIVIVPLLPATIATLHGLINR